jgi:PKD repeat protein
MNKRNLIQQSIIAFLIILVSMVPRYCTALDIIAVSVGFIDADHNDVTDSMIAGGSYHYSARMDFKNFNGATMWRIRWLLNGTNINEEIMWNTFVGNGTISISDMVPPFVAPVGTHTVTFYADCYNEVDEAMYEYNNTISRVFTVIKQNQTIDFAEISNKLTTDVMELAATSSSGLPVSFSVASGPAAITGDTYLVFTGAGVVSVVATQGGDANRNPAPDITNTFEVAKAYAQVYMLNMTQTYTGSKLTASVTTMPAGLTVEITYDGLTTGPINVGTYMVAGTVNSTMYQGSIIEFMAVEPADPTVITVPTAGTLTYQQALAEAALTGGIASVPGIFVWTDESIRPNAGETNYPVTFIPDDQINNNNVLVDVNVYVEKAEQILEHLQISDKLTTDMFSLSAWVNSGLPISYEVADGPAILLDGTKLSFTGTGTVYIVAWQDGDINWQPVDRVTNSFEVWAPLIIMTTSLPTGSVGCSYNAILQATNSLPPYTWSIMPEIIGWGSDAFGISTVPDGLERVISIEAGDYHSMALKEDGTVVTWGDHHYGVTNVPTNLSNVTAISSGGNHCLALKADGKVVAWGANWYGQANVPTGLSNVIAIAGGYNHSIALKPDGTVAAWGHNSDGQVTVPGGLNNVIAIVGKYNHNLAMKSDGSLVAWGRSSSGQTTVPHGLSNVISFVGGSEFSLALISDGTIVSWGGNSYGPVAPSNELPGIVEIDAGVHHGIALSSGGEVFTWGGNYLKQLDVPCGLNSVRKIAAGSYHNLALREKNTQMPAGLSCSAEGIISGVPEHVGTNRVTFVVQDSRGARTNQTIEIIILPTTKDQTITFPLIEDQVTTDVLGLTASASSDLPVAFIVQNGPAIIMGGTNLMFTGEGEVSIVASQAGDANWNPAPEVTNTFYVFGVCELTVVSAHGAPEPSVGSHNIIKGAIITNILTGSPEILGGVTQLLCTGWTMVGNAPESGAGTTFAAYMTNDAVLTWHWNTNFWLDTEAGVNGEINVADGWRESGADVLITATASNGYHFFIWGGDTDGCTIEGNQITVPMDKPRTITAAFEINVYGITATAGMNGSVIPSGVVPVPHGGSTSITVQAMAGAHIIQVQVDGINTGVYTAQDTTRSIAFSNVESDHVLTASFNLRPAIMLTATPTNGVAPLRVTVDFSGSTDPDGAIARSEFDKDGDGLFETVMNGAGRTVVTYPEPGVYTATGVVYDAYGASAASSVRIEVLGRNPEAILTASPTNGAAPLSVSFDGTNSTAAANHQIVVYEWDFNGDGRIDRITATGLSTYVYASPGDYQAVLRITDDQGLTGSATLAIAVEPPVLVPPAVTLTASTNAGYLPLIIAFTAEAMDDGQVVQYRWDFDGDGGIDLVSSNNAASYRYTVAANLQRSGRRGGQRRLVGFGYRPNSGVGRTGKTQGMADPAQGR